MGSNMMNRMKELDFIRAIAMLSVITIHVTSTYINYDSSVLVLGMNVAFILNQITRFAVPLFIMLSGISLGLRTSSCSFRDFLRKRLVKIGIPYVVWSAVYMLYNNHSDLSALNVRSVLTSILLGRAASHLYFIIIIFQLYLLFPALKRWVEASPCQSIAVSFIISYGIQELFYLLKYDFDLIPAFIRPYLWLLFPTWLFYFIMGLVLTDTRLIYIRKITSQHSVAIILTTLVFACIYVVESGATGSLDSIKSSLNIYVPLVFLASFSVWKYLGRFQAAEILTRFLAKHSMTIYFGHVLILYFFRRFSLFYRGMSGMILLLAVVVVTSCAAAVLIDSLVGMIRTR